MKKKLYKTRKNFANSTISEKLVQFIDAWKSIEKDTRHIILNSLFLCFNFIYKRVENQIRIDFEKFYKYTFLKHFSYHQKSVIKLGTYFSCKCQFFLG